MFPLCSIINYFEKLCCRNSVIDKKFIDRKLNCGGWVRGVLALASSLASQYFISNTNMKRKTYSFQRFCCLKIAATK